MKFTFLIAAIVSLIAPITVDAMPFVYDEATDGDITVDRFTGTPEFEFGVGENSITGRFGFGRTADDQFNSDFDEFIFVIGENQRLAELTYTYFDTDIAETTIDSSVDYRILPLDFSSQCIFQDTNLAGNSGGQISHTSCDTTNPFLTSTLDFGDIMTGSWFFNQSFGLNGPLGSAAGGFWGYNFTFTIEAVSVSAPATVFLFVFGLMGVRLATRSRLVA